MTCRWVINSRLTTFGRRVVITSAVFGLTTVGSAGLAFGAGDTVGVSPKAPVVSVVPTAVSVTFRESLRASGAQVLVISKDGDVGVGEVSTSNKTLRRSVREGAPNGDYTVKWKAVSTKGKKMSGSFTFTAARGNGVIETTPAPSPSPVVVVTTAAPTPAPTATPAATATSEPTETAEIAATVTPSAEPTTTPASTSSVEPSGTPGWISGGDPVWTPEPTVTSSAVVVAGSGSGSGSSGSGSVSTGFTAVPLTVGGLLVLAAGMVSVFNRPRLRARS